MLVQGLLVFLKKKTFYSICNFYHGEEAVMAYMQVFMYKWDPNGKERESKERFVFHFRPQHD